MPDKKTILLAAGGTGGHLFPAEALAEELLKRGHRVVIVTDKRGNAFKSLDGRAEIHTVRAGYLKPGILAKIKSIADMGIGFLQSLRLHRKVRPDIVVGFGGYPSFPGVLAAQALGISTVLHEQNAVLGKANRHLAPRARKIAVSLPGTQGIGLKDSAKVAVTGNPVRANIVAVRETPYPAPEKEFRLLITGGSQAASVFSDIVPAALALLPEALKARVLVMHQCRPADLERTQKSYDASGIRAQTAPFFADMPERLKACHLFIGRSGASTVAEIAVVGRPAIFVPYPGHKDMQQKFNAEVIAGKGGGWVILQQDLTPETLAGKIRALLEAPEGLAAAAAAAKTCGKPDAASALASLVEGP